MSLIGRGTSSRSAGVAAAMLLVPLGLVAPERSAASAGPAAPVIARTAVLSVHAPGQPASPDPARQLASASLRQDLARGDLTGSVVLRADPELPLTADLHVWFGRLDEAGSCAPDPAPVGVTTPTTGTPAAGFTRSGRVFTVAVRGLPGGTRTDLDCAGVALTPEGGFTAYDVLEGQLVDVLGAPRLTVGRVALIGRERTPVRLARGWTRLDVAVRNEGTAVATGIRLAGSGAGLRVRAASLGTLVPGATRDAPVWVRLSGERRRSTLRLVVTGGAVSAARTVAVRQVAAPRRPVDGRYRARLGSGDLRFRVADGHVSGFAGRLRATCRVSGAVVTRTVSVDFPRARIRRTGLVQALDRRRPATYAAGLDLRIAGERVTRARFWSQSGQCRVEQAFTARRAGR